MNRAQNKYRKWMWVTALLSGLAAEITFIIMFCVSMWRGNNQIPLWQAFIFMAIAVWIYIAYLKQRAEDISRFVVDEKVKTHLLVQNLREGIILADPEDRILVLNHKASEITGFQEIDCLGQNLADKLDESIAALLRSGQDGERTGKVKQTDRNIHISIINLPSNKTEGAHKLIYVQEAAEDLPSEISPAISLETEHVIRRLKCLSNELLSSRNSISAAWVLLQSLAAQFELALLPFTARISDSSLPLENKAQCSIKELVNNIMSNIIIPARANGITLEVEGCRDDRLFAAGDQDLLSKALEQVLYNALLGDHDGPLKVTVRAAPLGDSMGILVGDNGAAIDSDSLPELFACPYNGVTGPDGNPVRRNALGLNLARVVVEAHGGTLVAESPAEGGLLVTMMLPGGNRD